jgi:hypothetical protein
MKLGSLAWLFTILACGDDAAPRADGGGFDASIADGGAPRTDGGPEAADAGPLDAGFDAFLPPCHDDDGDSIATVEEGTGDRDGDGLPNAGDPDSDGDGLLDADEAGDADPCTAPLDSDLDAVADFLEVDSDGNGVGDADESGDADGDGALDRIELDDDADGFADLIEWAAESDPSDPSSVPAEGYYVVASSVEDRDIELPFHLEVTRADAVFEVATTAAMGGTITALEDGVRLVIAPAIAAVVDFAMAVVSFRDFPVVPVGVDGDHPFGLRMRVTDVVDDMELGLVRLGASGGADARNSAFEALYQTFTGEGVAWPAIGASPRGSVRAFDPLTGYDPAHHGLVGGVGFRAGALPIVVHFTDSELHSAADYWALGIDEAHSRAQAMDAARALGARFTAVTSFGGARRDLESIATETGATVLPVAWGATETRCRTGIGGSARPTNVFGRCPLTYDGELGGAGDHLQAIDAIRRALGADLPEVTGAAFDNDDPTLDSAAFVSTITPVAPAPGTSTIDGERFLGVPVGTDLSFRVVVRNDVAPSMAAPQLHRTTVRAVSGNAWLAEATLHVVVPGGGVDL